MENFLAPQKRCVRIGKKQNKNKEIKKKNIKYPLKMVVLKAKNKERGKHKNLERKSINTTKIKWSVKKEQKQVDIKQD